MLKRAILIIVSLVFGLGFLVEQQGYAERKKEHDHHDDHGVARSLGTARLLDKRFDVEIYGDLEPGKEGAIGVKTSDNVADLSIFVWVENKEGKKLCAPAKGVNENGEYHFHVVPKKGSSPHQLVIRVKDKNRDEKKVLQL